jgi:hypothetical protein
VGLRRLNEVCLLCGFGLTGVSDDVGSILDVRNRVGLAKVLMSSWV